MRATRCIGVVAVGGVLTFTGVTQAFESAGLLPNLQLVFGWSMMAVLGLYLVAWGLTKLMLSRPASNHRAVQSSSSGTALGVPSAHSHAKRRNRNERRDRR